MDRKTVYALLAGLAATLVLVWGVLGALLARDFFEFSEHDATAGPIIMYVVGTLLAIAVVVVVGIGIFVYRDAKKRGMPAVLWALVAVFVPYFVGLIVYLIARQMRQGSCPRCGGAAPADAAFCPHCGQPVQRTCAACRGRIPPDGRFCPSCGAAVAA